MYSFSLEEIAEATKILSSPHIGTLLENLEKKLLSLEEEQKKLKEKEQEMMADLLVKEKKVGEEGKQLRKQLEENEQLYTRWNSFDINKYGSLIRNQIIECRKNIKKETSRLEDEISSLTDYFHSLRKKHKEDWRWDVEWRIDGIIKQHCKLERQLALFKFITVKGEVL